MTGGPIDDDAEDPGFDLSGLDRPVDADGADLHGDGTISWRELVREIAEQFATIGIDGAEHNAMWIVRKACGAEPDEWPSLADRPATVRGVAAIDAMAGRRAAGEPLQYVLGEWSFRYLDLFLDRRVLIPRPETEIVAGVALAELHRLAPGSTPVLAADLGTGSGAIGLALASEHPAADVWLTDVSPDALAVARANIAGLGRAGSRVRVAHGSWFEALPTELAGGFGVIVSNPPYVSHGEELPAEVAQWEPAGALYAGPDGTEHLRHLVEEGGHWLVDEGALVLELAPVQAAVVAEQARNWFVEVSVERDLTGRDRVIVARRPRR